MKGILSALSLLASAMLLLSTAGCTGTKVEAPSASPQESFASLLVAMRDGDLAGVEELTTDRGMHSLLAGVGDEDKIAVFKRWGQGWSSWELRWQTPTEERATANLGPEPKEQWLDFIRTEGGWKLDRWVPGE